MKIVRTDAFSRSVKKIGASAADVAKLEQKLAKNPLDGDAIPGLPGARKSRFGLGQRGSRGGGRAIYIWVRVQDAIVLLLAYDKKDQTDLSPAQRKAIADALRDIKL